MEIFILQCCSKKDEQRQFSIVGVFDSISHAKEYISQEDEYDHFIDRYHAGAPCSARRVYQSW